MKWLQWGVWFELLFLCRTVSGSEQCIPTTKKQDRNRFHTGKEMEGNGVGVTYRGTDIFSFHVQFEWRIEDLNRFPLEKINANMGMFVAKFCKKWLMVWSASAEILTELEFWRQMLSVFWKSSPFERRFFPRRQPRTKPVLEHCEDCIIEACLFLSSKFIKGPKNPCKPYWCNWKTKLRIFAMALFQWP